MGAVGAGCGGSTGSSAATHTPAQPVQTQVALTAKPVTDYLSYVHGKNGKADPALTPVTLGYVAQQGGAVEPGPLAGAGADVAVKYINEQLGGIGGHPLRLSTCYIRNAEEEGARCAQQFLSDHAVKGVVTGAVAVGIQSFYATVAGQLPVVSGVALTNVDRAQANAAILYGDTQAILAPFATYAAQVLHARTAALVFQETPDLTAGAASIAAALTSAGVKVKKVAYAPTTTDLIGPLTAAGAASADMVVPVTNPAGCVNMVNSLRQVGIDEKKVVASPVCLTGDVAKALGGDFPQWTYAIASSLPADTTDKATVPYNAVFKQYGAADKAIDPWAEVAFGEVMTAARAMNTIGVDQLTPSALRTQLTSFAGPMIMGAPQLKCGKIPGAPGLCSDAAQFFRYLGKGRFENASGGFLRPPRQR
jgi:branched-chain amino acid transport system substrate-binding protein